MLKSQYLWIKWVYRLMVRIALVKGDIKIKDFGPYSLILDLAVFFL